MNDRRHAPAQFRSKRKAVIAFLIGVALLALAWFALRYALSLDYASRIEADFEQKEAMSPEGYVAITPEPVVKTETQETSAPKVYATATPAPTEVPLEKYSSKAMGVAMPDMMFDTVEAEVTSMTVPEANENRLLCVEGWGYLEGYDAENSTIYLAVSPFHASDYRFYNVTRRTDMGSEFGSADGENLQWSGFECFVAVDTYSDGDYNLGVYIVNKLNKKETVEGYLSLASTTRFTVSGGKITRNTFTE